MQCPNCSQEIPDKAQFCGYCGQRLEEVEATKPAEPSPPPEPPPPPEPEPQEPPPEVEAAEPEPEEPAPKPPTVPPVAEPAPSKPKRGLPGWVLGLVGLVVVVAVVGALVVTGVIDLGSAQPTQTCQGPVAEWVEIESARLNQRVKLDGKMTNNKEWSDATCLDLTLTELDSGSVRMPSRWWIKNDAEWLYLLVRVPAEELIDGPSASDYGVAIAYFWPEYSGESWPYSDWGEVNQDNNARDQYGWDEERWYEDIQASPPGEDNVQGTMSQDGTYVWFEFRKALNSGDGRDWDWSPGETIGEDESALLLGAWGTTDATWFQIDSAIRLAE